MSVPKHLLITIAIFDKFRLSKNQWTFFSLFLRQKNFSGHKYFLDILFIYKMGKFYGFEMENSFYNSSYISFWGKKN